MMKTLISAGIGVAAILVFVVFALPKYNETLELRAQVRDLDQVLDNAKQLSVKWSDLLDSYNSFNPMDLQKLDRMLPGTIDNMKLIIETDALSSALGLSMKDISVDENKDEGLGSEIKPFGSVKLTLSLSGPYEKFIPFLERLEKNLRIIDVTSVSFAGSGESEIEISDVYDYEIELTTYWLK